MTEQELALIPVVLVLLYFLVVFAVFVAYIAAAGVDVVVAAVDAVVACVGELVVDKAWAPFLSCCCREHWSSWSELAATRNRKKPEVLIDLNKLYFNFSSITFLTPVLSLPP